MTTKKCHWNGNNRPQDIRIGKYFMLSDFLYSAKAAIVGIPNCPPLDGIEVQALRGLAEHVLDPVVDKFGPLSITYGYTCPELHAKLYGANSRHGVHDCVPAKAKGAELAAAADILVHKMIDLTKDEPREVLFWIKDNCEFDRLILYPGSEVICTAWADKPRFDCKEWIYPDVSGFEKAVYVNAKRRN